MELRIIHEADTVYKFLEDKTRYDYIYQFNNLSREQWKNVVCYGLFEGTALKQTAMVNINYGIPVLLAAAFSDIDLNIELIGRIKKFLPGRFYTHIDKATLEAVFSKDGICDYEEYFNMGLSRYDTIDRNDSSGIVRLGYENIEAIKELLSISYPEAWLDDQLVKLKENFGIYIDGSLISFAGIHAYSEQYQVAAVAHVTTLPEYRRRGYAERVVAELLKSLSPKIRFIGLNVKSGNLAAISCYKRLGFEEYGRFIACEIVNG